jgi:hypothetical protein
MTSAERTAALLLLAATVTLGAMLVYVVAG